MTATPDEVRTAIATVESSRKTHVQWRDHWQGKDCRGECAECASVVATAGGIDHHEECIRGYDQVLAVLTSLLPEETR